MSLSLRACEDGWEHPLHLLSGPDARSALSQSLESTRSVGALCFGVLGPQADLRPCEAYAGG